MSTALRRIASPVTGIDVIPEDERHLAQATVERALAAEIGRQGFRIVGRPAWKRTQVVTLVRAIMPAQGGRVCAMV